MPKVVQTGDPQDFHRAAGTWDEPMLCTIFKHDAPVRGGSLVFPVAGPPPGIERQLASEQIPINPMLEL